MALVDLRLGTDSGLDLLEGILRRSPRTAVVIITAHGNAPDAAAAMKLGAVDFLTKPMTPGALRTVVARALARGTDGGNPADGARPSR